MQFCVLYLLKDHVLIFILTLFQVLGVHLSKDLRKRSHYPERNLEKATPGRRNSQWQASSLECGSYVPGTPRRPVWLELL